MLARLATFCLILLTALPLRAEPVTVFAAASLKTALDQVAEGFTRETGYKITVSHAGSSVLARQIQMGAPAQVFLSANALWMDALERDGLIDPDSRFNLAGNRLVLVAHGPTKPVAITPELDLSAMLGAEGRIAMALVQAVPVGIYGKAALEHLGLWQEVAPRVAQADNARAALALVALGQTPLGVVYATDAAAEPRVSVIGTFPADSHAPITYPAAATSEAGPAARAFLTYLGGEQARAVLAAHGFLPANEAAQ